ncbi:hypothetical protein BFW01_g11770 [Lasiodiplodia theobromae]|nr:hypothetical protein BFW01_g11770 [Lasiodiplodia theobromae]
MPPAEEESPPQLVLPISGSDAVEEKGIDENDRLCPQTRDSAASDMEPHMATEVLPEPQTTPNPEPEIRDTNTQESSGSENLTGQRVDSTPLRYDSTRERHRVSMEPPRPPRPRPSTRDMAEAESVFTRRCGIIYAPEEFWSTYRICVHNCHFYVSSAADKAIPAENSDNQSGQGTTWKLDSPERRPSTRGTLSYNLPSRILITNLVLRDEMGRFCGISRFNANQAAPFKTIVSFEKGLRRLHEEKERQFAELATLHPNHPAVQRREPWLPNQFCYGHYEGDSEAPLSQLESARIVLDGLRSLMYLFDNDLAHLIETNRKIEAGTVDKIPFAYLWHLFRPGQKIVARDSKPQVFIVLQVTGGRRPLPESVPRGDYTLLSRSKPSGRRAISSLAIDCFYVDFDGVEFGAVPGTLYIAPFDDVRPVTSLFAYPLEYEQEVSENHFLERGKRFVELVKVRHQRYSGLSLTDGDLFDRQDEIDSDVMIDFELAFRNSEQKIEVPDFGGGVILKPTEENPDETMDHPVGHTYDDADWVQMRWSKFVHSTDLLEVRTFQELSNDHLILLPYRVYGYALLNRKWFPLDIDLFTDVPVVNEGDNDGFDKLILPDGHKEIVRALVKTHARQNRTGSRNPVVKASERQFDVVKGKGKGLIILLHGAPGVGKTSTAECVAANSGRPLFPITCGDIGGTSAQQVEKNLEKFFELARKWNCVLLLDEADVFLSARTKGDIQQNILVSVFLRVLEYYSGILILTTNRVGDFDEAVKSRVHCALYYPPLDEMNTEEVWKMNLDLLEDQNESPDCEVPIRFKREDIMGFARRHWKEGNRWNGRQIKNAFQTAVSLADWDDLKNSGGDSNARGPRLRRKHFKTVAKASAHFDMYLEKVRRDDVTRAKQDELRRDELTNDLTGKHGGKVREFGRIKLGANFFI